MRITPDTYLIIYRIEISVLLYNIGTACVIDEIEDTRIPKWRPYQEVTSTRTISLEERRLCDCNC